MSGFFAHCWYQHKVHDYFDYCGNTHGNQPIRHLYCRLKALSMIEIYWSMFLPLV
jgi:hypothetical protein